MSKRNGFLPLLVLSLNVLVAMVIFGAQLVSLRSYIVFVYLLLCPGLSWAFTIPAKDFVTRLFLVVVISIGVDTVIAELFLYAGLWSPQLILMVLMVVSLLGLVFETLVKFPKVKI